MDCSQRTIQGSKVYFTNSRDCCSILEKMRHQSLSEDKVRHFWIWLIVNQSIQRMLDCLFYYRSQYTYKHGPAVLQWTPKES